MAWTDQIKSNQRSIMNSLGMKMASPGVFWEWRRTMAGVTGSQGFSTSQVLGKFFLRHFQMLATTWKTPTFSSFLVFTIRWALPSKLFWNLATSSHSHPQSLIQVSLSPTWVTVHTIWLASFLLPFWCRPEQVSLFGIIWWLSISLSEVEVASVVSNCL